MARSLTERVGLRDSAAHFCYRAAMPFLDPFRAHRKHGLAFALHMLTWNEAQEKRRRDRRGRRKDLGDGGVPVEPNRPKNLYGGAAAALEFEDDGKP